MPLSKLRLRSKRERGTVVVEMAIALPLLLLIVAGIVDLGFLFWEQEVLTNAAREGARAGARAVVDGAPEMTVTQVKTVVQNYLNNFNIKNSSGSPLTLSTGSNFFYQWDTSADPVTLSVRLQNIPVRMMMLPNIQALFAGGQVSTVVNLNTRITMAAEWVKTKTPSP